MATDVKYVKRLEERLAVMERKMAMMGAFTSGDNGVVGGGCCTSRDIVDEDHLVGFMTIGGGRSVFEEWGMDSFYEYEDGKMKGHRVDQMKIYPQEKFTMINRSNFMLVCGPGDQEEAVPEWGTLGLYPYLVQMRIPFFNGQLPSIKDATTREWIVGYYQAMQHAVGVTIVIYDTPWNAYFETAVFLWFFGQGCGAIYFMQHADLEVKHYKGSVVTRDLNLPGAQFEYYTKIERQYEVFKILKEGIQAYCSKVHDGTSRIRTTLTNTRGGIVDMFMAKKLSGICSDATNQLSSTVDERRALADTLFIGMETDIAVYLRIVYQMSLYGSGSHMRGAVETTIYARLVGQAQAIILAYRYKMQHMTPSAHSMAVDPVIEMINLMLPLEARME